MKKLFLLLLMLFAGLFLFSACGGQTQQAPPAAKSESSPPPSVPSLAVGEQVYASYMQLPNQDVELAKVVEVKGDEVHIAWNNTWTKKGHEVETRKLGEILRFKPLTKEEAIIGCEVIINPQGFSSWVNFPGKITAVKGDLYTVAYNSGGAPKTEDAKIDKLVKLVK